MSLPHYPALVLNADYTPINLHPLSTWPFDRTLRNVMKDRVTVVAEYDTVLRSPTFEYKPPSVVALKNYVNRPKRVIFNRLNIFLRDNYTCQYCGQKFHAHDLTFDHVVPRSQGGRTEFTNIVTACVACNTKKGSRMDMKPRVAPFEPKTLRKADLNISREKLHHTWLDYLYWSGTLEDDNL